MEWLYYLLEANLYLLLFYGFYRLFLANETFYNNNRYYLLLSCITAFILPILQLGFLNPAPIVDNVKFPPPILLTAEQLAKITVTPIQKQIDYTSYLYPIYLFIAFCLAIKLIFSLSKIINIWLKSKKSKTGNVTLIELNGQTTAFSFFNLLFIHPHLAEKETVMSHEMVHIKQKHSLDILFFEVLQITCWFNPIIYFIKKDIKLLHEYIADDLSTRKDVQKHEYAMFLIENSFGVLPTPLTNQIFNQSILKRRINMLNKKRTAGWARLKMLLTLPLVGGMLCASTMAFTKDYGYLDLLPEKSLPAITDQEVPKTENPKRDQVKFPPPIVKPNGKQWFTPLYKRDKTTGKPILSEKRHIIINGKAIENIKTFYGVSNAETVKYLNQKSAIAKYGDKGENGAVEITGENIKYFDKITLPKAPAVEPPPPSNGDRVKFPPPIVRPDKPKKGLKNPPTVEAPPPGYKTKTDQIKFPPPIVKPDEKTSSKKVQTDASNKPELLEVVIKADPKKSENDDFTGNTIKVSNLIDRTRGKKLIITTANNAKKSINIYDRWGNLVFADKNYNNDWDGNFSNVDDLKSNIIHKGTYYYIASTIGNDSKGDLVKGYLTIE